MLCSLKPCRVQSAVVFPVVLAGACVCQCNMHCSEIRQHLLAKGSWRCSFETVTWTQPLDHVVFFHDCRAHYEDDGQHEARGELVAESTGGQISSRLLSMRSANALVELPKASGALPAGSTVSALLIADLAGMPDSEQLGITSLPSGQWGW